MAYTAKCDTATHTKWWITGTGTSVNRLSEVMDDNPSGVEEDDNPGNYQPWSEFMTEHVEDAVYQIHQNFEIGDDTTSTTLESPNEMVYFDQGINVETKINATLTIGEIVSTYSASGSKWSIKPATGTLCSLSNRGTVNIYGSIIEHRMDAGHISKPIAFGGPGNTTTIKNSIFIGSKYSHGNNSIDFNFGTISLEDVFFTGFGDIRIVPTPTKFQGVWIHDSINRCLEIANNSGTVTINGGNYTDVGSKTIHNYWTVSALDIYLVNYEGDASGITQSNVQINHANSTINLQWTVNVRVTDKDGNNLSGVTVNLEGSDVSNYDTDMWTEDSVTTNASGIITEQTITAKKWVGTSETETDYGPFRLALSKDGYETLVLENITIDSPVDLQLELQPQKQPPKLIEYGI